MYHVGGGGNTCQALFVEDLLMSIVNAECRQHSTPLVVSRRSMLQVQGCPPFHHICRNIFCHAVVPVLVFVFGAVSQHALESVELGVLQSHSPGLSPAGIDPVFVKAQLLVQVLGASRSAGKIVGSP